MEAAAKLERIATDIQDIEYTLEQGKLWLLQTHELGRPVGRWKQ
jgi:pyruvate,orthophosphate dikinase